MGHGVALADTPMYGWKMARNGAERGTHNCAWLIICTTLVFNALATRA